MSFFLTALLLALTLVTSLPVDTYLAPHHQYENAREGCYVVVFKNESHPINLHLANIQQNFTATEILALGYHAKITPSQLRAVRQDPDVEYVEDCVWAEFASDYTVHLVTSDDTLVGKSSDSIYDTLEQRTVTRGVRWGLAMLSRNGTAPDNACHFLNGAGDAVDVYIMDTGIVHIPQFGDRVYRECLCSTAGLPQGLQHGTYVASLAGSGKFGSAKMPKLRDCRVTSDDGVHPSSEFINAGLAKILNSDKERRKSLLYMGAVINMSFSMPQTIATATLLLKTYNQGISLVAAAMNENANTWTTFPCFYSIVICVGAMNKTYYRAEFSNFGKMVNIWAPGQRVLAFHVDVPTKPVGIAEISGTSFAAPYVVGILATFYGHEGRAMNPGRAWELLALNPEKGILKDLKGGKNSLANNGFQKAKNGPIKSAYLGAPVFSFDPTKAAAAKAAAPTP